MRARWQVLGISVVLILLAGRTPAWADVGSDMKKAGKSIGKAAKEFGETVASESKKIGESVADATEDGAKTAWYETEKWTTRESKRVADATAKWWDGVIHEKESTCDRLRRENKELKKSAEKAR